MHIGCLAYSLPSYISKAQIQGLALDLSTSINSLKTIPHRCTHRPTRPRKSLIDTLYPNDSRLYQTDKTILFLLKTERSVKEVKYSLVLYILYNKSPTWVDRHMLSCPGLSLIDWGFFSCIRCPIQNPVAVVSTLTLGCGDPGVWALWYPELVTLGVFLELFQRPSISFSILAIYNLCSPSSLSYLLSTCTFPCSLSLLQSLPPYTLWNHLADS